MESEVAKYTEEPSERDMTIRGRKDQERVVKEVPLVVL